jgi:SAM-dependent methyltransferase
MRRVDAPRFFQDYAVEFADIYAGGDGPWSRYINRRFRRSMQLRFAKSLSACAPATDKSILDVGCGPGHYGVALLRAGARRVVGVDSSPAMIQLATSRAQSAGLLSRCEFRCEPWESWPPGERFDHVICMGFLEYRERPSEDIAKVMACTGRSALFSLPDAAGFLAWQRRIRYRFKTPLHMYKREDVERLFTGCVGVAQFTVEPLDRDFFVTACPRADRPLDSGP